MVEYSNGATRLKVGLLSFAHVHALGYARLLRDWPGVDLLTVDPCEDQVPADEVRGERLALELGVPYVDTYEELFAWGPDAVVVCAENARHCELVKMAASYGCDVLCEKPLATSIEDGEAMVEACASAGVFLMVAYPVRFSPHFQILRSALKDGLLGTPQMALGTNNGKIPVGERAWFTNPELSGGGALVDHVVHVADLLDVLMGGVLPAAVRAVTNRVLHAEKSQVEVETGAVVSLKYPNGFCATIDSSWSQPDDAPTWGGLTLRVFGSKGIGHIAPFDDHIDVFTQTGDFPHALHLGFGEDLDRLMLRAFLDGARTGVGPQPDGEVGLRTLRIVCAAQESARTGQVVQVG